jgi:NAD(P)-dependent dehydrogenase (short-subunit alcohol dehydrogenase family)
MDKTILITGGSSGIGEAIAKKFLKEGTDVIIFDTKKPNYGVNFYRVDIKSEESIQEAFLHIKRLDVLINNAGVYLRAAVDKTSKEQLDNIIDTNLKGTFLVSKHALPLIKESKGSIINISSGLGLVPEPESSAYCATKAGIIMLTKTMAQEYADQGIRINAVLPGPIDTPMLREAFASEEELQQYAKINPMKRIGQPEEVAELVFFLSSNKSNYITGGLYSVDGGESSSSLYSK